MGILAPLFSAGDSDGWPLSCWRPLGSWPTEDVESTPSALAVFSSIRPVTERRLNTEINYSMTADMEEQL